MTGQAAAAAQRWLPEPSSRVAHRDRPRVPSTSMLACLDTSASDAAGSPSATSVHSGIAGVGTIWLTVSMMNCLAACSSSSRSKTPGTDTNGICQA